MADISMDLVRKLREKTQVGMMDCKKALEESNGDLEKAIEILRKKGAAVAAKRADNETNNGRIEAYVSDNFKQAALVKVVCETDFSANTDAMKQFVLEVAERAVASNCDDKKALIDTNKELKNHHEELLAKISERIEIDTIRLFQVANHGVVMTYIHPGSTIGTIVELATEVEPSGHLDALKAAARDVCMHIAVTNPPYLKSDEVESALIEKERAIAEEQMAKSGKPANILAKIIENKINKYIQEICLVDQRFIKNEDLTITQYLEQISKEIKNKITIKRFARLAIGR